VSASCPSSHSHFYHSSTAITMPQSLPENTARANYQSIFDDALQEYKRKTRKDLPSEPLFNELQSCGSPDDIIAILRQQISGFNPSASGSSDDRLTRWLDPTVKAINAFSSAIGGAVALVSRSAYEVNRHDNIYSTDISTWRGDFYGDRYPPVGANIDLFLSQAIIVTS
jgi:hypothetical protein